MESNKICMACMKDMGNYEVCKYCGWIENTPPDKSWHLPPRTVLADRYLVGTVLGSGGFGILYRAWDRKLETPVAIKEYFPEGNCSRKASETKIHAFESENCIKQYKDGVQYFLSEARTMAKFRQHSNIVNTQDFFEENNTAYIVMEYLEGVTLRESLKAKGKMSFAEAVETIQPILKAVDALHHENILHRDISPDNIFCLSNGGLKLIDFGSACGIDKAGSENPFITFKPGYAPPEQCQNQPQDRYTDIYALGATLYRMVTGIAPKGTQDHSSDNLLTPPSYYSRDLTPEQEYVIIKAMDFIPTLRFQSIPELEDALLQCKKPTPAPKRIFFPKLSFWSYIVCIVSIAILSGIIWFIYQEVEDLKTVVEQPENTVLAPVEGNHFANEPPVITEPTIGDSLSQNLENNDTSSQSVTDTETPPLDEIPSATPEKEPSPITESTEEDSPKPSTQADSPKTEKVPVSPQIPEPPTVKATEPPKVPDLTHKPEQEAISLLSKLDLNYTKQSIYSDIPAGYVAKQDIEPGEEIQDNTSITFWVSLGELPRGYTIVPDIIGMSYGEAKEIIQEANLHLYGENNYYSPSTIITAQYPDPETIVKADSTVTWNFE